MDRLVRAASVVFCAIAFCALASSVSAQPVVNARGDIVSLRALGNDSATAMRLTQNVTLKFSELSTISAIEAVADGTADMALSARPMHADNPKESTLAFEPIAWDAIVAITHTENPVSNITLRQLREIYAGRIKTWDQIGGRAAPIHLNAVAGPMDGIEYGLRKALFGRGHIPVAAERWYLNTLQLEAGIAIDPDGLAVSSLSNVFGNPKLKRLMLEGVTATRDTLEQGEYLLATPIYLVHRAGPDTGSPVDRYLHFLRTDPPSRVAMQRRELLPIREADVLNDIYSLREQKILAMLETPVATVPDATTTTIAVAPPVAPVAPPTTVATPTETASKTP